MPENNSVHAPYNFVPFSNKVLIAYPSPEELPAHDAVLPELKSGEIHITLKSDTPVFVSDGSKTADGKQDLHFFRLPNGTLAIPGTTVRGMVRENMQILGFGLARPGEDLEDQQIFFRDVASSSKSVSANAKAHYRAVLNTQTIRDPENGRSRVFPANVKSGYLCREADGYLIQPTKEPYYRVSRKHPDAAVFGENYAKTIPVSFVASDGRVKTVSVQKNAPSGARKGILLFTGKAVKQPNHLYLFPEPDFDAPEIRLSEADVTAYKVDLEGRRNALKGLQKNQDPYRTRDEKEWLSFWELPGKEGESKPVFYIRHNGHLFFGMSAFLRVAYPHSLAEGLPRRHRQLNEEAPNALDFPHAILGFADAESAYRSRVSFGDFPAEQGAKELESVSLILGNPKPGYYPGYVRDGKDYTAEDFELRGYKQYWLKEVQKSAIPGGKEKVGTVMRPLPKSTTFHGIIRFRNLSAVELGLLLWSLRLEDGCFQTIGMGKPYGYGRMKLTIESLKLLDHAALYGADLSAPARTDETAQISDYIRQYDEFASRTLRVKKPRERPSILSMEEIRDFIFIKRSIRTGPETAYMELKEYQNVRNALPTVKDLREREDPAAVNGAAQARPESVEDFRSQLLKLQRKL